MATKIETPAATAVAASSVWGWPLVNMHNRHQMFSKVKDHAIGRRPAGARLRQATEDFEAFMRTYWADTPILENKWSPPPVIRRA